MTGFSIWTYATATLLYAGLSAWQLTEVQRERMNRPLFAALSMTAIWAGCLAANPQSGFILAFAEAGRSLAWIGFMYAMIRQSADGERQRAVRAVYAAVLGVILLQSFLAAASALGTHDLGTLRVIGTARNSLGLITAAGLLVLIHNLYGQASTISRSKLELPIIALAAFWAYDLHFYTLAYLTGRVDPILFAMRGGIAALLVPLFAIAVKRDGEWRVQLSRRATFQSLSIIAVLLYLILMMSLVRVAETAQPGWALYAQPVAVAGMGGIALAIHSSPKLRAWLRVMVSKHFFEHRYDYRADWLGFTRAIAAAGDRSSSLAERVVKALADIAGSPGGVLLVPDDGKLTPSGSWNWQSREAPFGTAPADFVTFLQQDGHILDLASPDEDAVPVNGAVEVPSWLRESGAWAGIPLIHNDRLAGLVLLDHPQPRRAMDWEDFDLFRTAGMQAASYIAEAQSQEALADAQRFDEFNRRFAFIMHDIKNLVSQLSLVARNAERHAENPEFRADMIATLQSSVKKMNDMLARLSRGNGGEAQAPHDMLVQPLVARIVETKRRAHPVAATGDVRIAAKADPAALEQALTHVVQNAIDASPPSAEVRIDFRAADGEVAIEVSDKGTGMSADFIRSRLFQPFASTKENGFGIGAFEAKTLVEAMGGRVHVSSREGEGSKFTIFLPLGEEMTGHRPERLRA